MLCRQVALDALLAGRIGIQGGRLTFCDDSRAILARRIGAKVYTKQVSSDC